MISARRLLGAMVAVTPLLMASDCGGYDRDDFQAPTDPGSQFLQLRTETGALEMEANGARLGIIATIDPNSTQRTVKFTTTEGSFAGAATTTPKEIQVTIDGLGSARADLISSPDPVTAVVKAEVVNQPAVAASIEIRFVPPDFTLAAAGGKTTLRADGEDTVTLIARLPASSLERTVRFTTDRGTLVGGTPTSGVAPNQDREVIADSTGRATIVLQSEADPGIAQVTAEPKGAPAFRRTLQIVFEQVDDVIRFVAAPQIAPADGKSASEFTVSVNLETAGLEVEFDTTAGSFSPTTQTTASIKVPVSQGTATALIYSPRTVSRAKVTATVPAPGSTAASTAGTASEFSTETFLDFTRALPDRIQVTLDQITVTDNTTDKLTVTATLLRDVGEVTENTVATFQARHDATGTTFGLFRNLQLTNSRGVATAEFFPAASGLTGNATIIVGAEGTDVTGSAGFKVEP